MKNEIITKWADPDGDLCSTGKVGQTEWAKSIGCDSEARCHKAHHAISAFLGEYD